LVVAIVIEAGDLFCQAAGLPSEVFFFVPQFFVRWLWQNMADHTRIDKRFVGKK
jgi:hypothetical protein